MHLMIFFILAINHDSLQEIIKFHRNQILHENTFDTLHILIQNCGLHDPLTQSLAQRLNLPLQVGEILK